MFFFLTLIASLAVNQPATAWDQTNTGCTPPRYEVIVVLATECPLAKLYAGRLNELARQYPQVQFRGVSANAEDTPAEVATFGKNLNFPFGSDSELLCKLGATRSPEVFFLINDIVAYQGRIDDQYSPGTNRSQPNRHDLAEALRETLAFEPISLPKTTAVGCRITLPKPPAGELTFADVATIVHRHCSGCHRPGEVGPMSLLTYQDVSGWREMIREVVNDGRMPPWHADPAHGKFRNARGLSAAEKKTLFAWLDAGAPRGSVEPAEPRFKSGWSIRPDLVLRMEKPFDVPAEGILEYQDFVLTHDFAHDTWVQAVEIRPGNSAVVHHLTALLRPKNGDPERMYFDAMQDEYFAIMGPGNAVTTWPPGVAKLIPAGWQLVLEVHYQTIGTPQTDQSTIGLQLVDARQVVQRAATRPMIKEDIILPPHQVTTVLNEWRLEEDLTLLSLVPHMHVRGRSMRITANSETLLNIPHYDFNWQHRYIFAEPKSFPRGTLIRATAVYDNTKDNPNNPDPSATVRHGPQTTDEMFQLNWDVTRTHENRHAGQYSQIALLVMVVFGAIFVVSRFRSGGKSSLLT
ncbi:hypothetical protein [Anatilimnocola floriformis]|uniref:hypothetical protein n=1 Tax=Anatilimnocola floriformis TaxID=2948575 RepID=UPI0020C36C28|nr:hypothetical protein [Anatilimnocola floriformis]